MRISDWSSDVCSSDLKLGCGHWLLLDILDEALAILGIILLRGLHDEAVHFGLTDLNAIGLADLGKQQAQANATNGDGAIFFAILLHFRASGFGIGFMSRFMLKLAPDLVEFGLHHARRHFEVVIGRELVKQLALHIGDRKSTRLNSSP